MNSANLNSVAMSLLVNRKYVWRALEDDFQLEAFAESFSQCRLNTVNI